MNLNFELLEKDIKYGLSKENEIENILKSYFNMDLFEKLSTFHPMDFKGKSLGCETLDYYFEIKSRRCNHDKYKSTMIGKNKIDFANKNTNGFFYFIFVFEDGIFYYKYNPLDKFETTIGGRFDRGRNELKPYFYIPIENLQKLEI